MAVNYAKEHLQQAVEALHNDDLSTCFAELAKAVGLLMESGDVPDMLSYTYDELPGRLESLAEQLLDIH